MSYIRNFYENYLKIIMPLSIKIGCFMFVRSVNFNQTKLNPNSIFDYI